MEKYGFIYLWYDRKHRRYYVGCHWGHINDSYICSSNWMRDAYRRRPTDFKRKILKSNIFSLKEMFDEEAKFLSRIKTEELGKRYYNLHNVNKNHWSTNESSKLTVGQKISVSHKNDPNWGKWNKGKSVHNEQSKQKLREANQKQFQDPTQVELRKQKSKELWSDPTYLEKQKKARSKEGFYKGFTGSHSDETKRKISEQKMGVKQSEESKAKIAQTVANLIWVTDGKSNKRINKLEHIPEGYRRGRTKQLESISSWQH